MTNLEYLKMRKSTDNRKPLIGLEADIEYRQALALEIIAEELIRHNEHERIKFDYLKLKGIKINKL